jgi:predicted amidophosphoribosyltransferase
MLPSYWFPPLPEHVSNCCVCGLPALRRLCDGCQALFRRFGWPIESIEFLSVSSKRDWLEKLIWTWKHNVEIGEALKIDMSDELESIAAGLSSYFERHQDRLLAGISMVTTVPSHVPLIGTAFSVAQRRAWFSVPVRPTGHKAGHWVQHSSWTNAERLARSSTDWVVDADVVDGQYVLVLDDLFVTGASMLSYARALRDAGAKPLRCVALARHVGDRHQNYWDALRIVRRTDDHPWTPANAAPKFGPEPGS